MFSIRKRREFFSPITRALVLGTLCLGALSESNAFAVDSSNVYPIKTAIPKDGAEIKEGALSLWHSTPAKVAGHCGAVILGKAGTIPLAAFETLPAMSWGAKIVPDFGGRKLSNLVLRAGEVAKPEGGVGPVYLGRLLIWYKGDGYEQLAVVGTVMDLAGKAFTTDNLKSAATAVTSGILGGAGSVVLDLPVMLGDKLWDGKLDDAFLFTKSAYSLTRTSNEWASNNWNSCKDSVAKLFSISDKNQNIADPSAQVSNRNARPIESIGEKAPGSMVSPGAMSPLK